MERFKLMRLQLYWGNVAITSVVIYDDCDDVWTIGSDPWPTFE